MLRPFPLLPLVLLTITGLCGCAPAPEDTGPFDEDNDLVPRRADCDDHDANIGTPQRFYEDADGDGFGNALVAKIGCEGEGAVANQDDCDDTDPAVYPGAPVYCSGVGDDCDDDHSITEIVDTITAYPDVDGDTFGDPLHPTTVCPGTEGYRDDATDCNDHNALIHPGAPEICADGVDDDCNSIKDGCELPVAGQPAVTASGSGTDLGYAVGNAGDSDGDGTSDLLIGAPGGGSSGQGMAWLVLGPVTGSLTLGASDFEITGETAGSRAGAAVAGAGDINADGFDDFLVGAPGTGVAAGVAWLVNGPVTANFSLADATARFEGSAGNRAGFAVAGTEDLDGLGARDILIGAPFASEGGKNAGVAYFQSGAPSGAISLDSLDVHLVGQTGDEAGSALAMPRDVTGDGTNDAAIGAPGYDGEKGAVYVATGALVETIALADADAILVGESACDRAGSAVSFVGDLNLDGYKELFIGAPADDAACSSSSAGAAYVVFGPLSGTLSLADANLKLAGAEAGDQAGRSLASTGDTQGDGLTDFVVGAPGADGGNGRGYLILGPITGVVDLASSNAWFTTTSSGAQLGFSASGAGDLQDDDRTDVVYGAPGESGNGAAYLYFGLQ